MALMAPRILFRERGSSMRREVATGSFTGAEACGAAGAAAGALTVCADPDATQPQRHTITKRNVTKLRFIRSLLDLLDRSEDCGFPEHSLTPGREGRSRELPKQIPSGDDANRRPAFHFAVAGEADPHEHDGPDDENVQARSHAIQKFVARTIHEVRRIRGYGI